MIDISGVNISGYYLILLMKKLLIFIFFMLFFFVKFTKVYPKIMREYFFISLFKTRSSKKDMGILIQVEDVKHEMHTFELFKTENEIIFSASNL